jgi:hypothetical protein
MEVGVTSSMASLNSNNIPYGLKMFAGSKESMELPARLEPFTFGADEKHVIYRWRSSQKWK